MHLSNMRMCVKVFVPPVFPLPATPLEALSLVSVGSGRSRLKSQRLRAV